MPDVSTVGYGGGACLDWPAIMLEGRCHAALTDSYFAASLFMEACARDRMEQHCGALATRAVQPMEVSSASHRAVKRRRCMLPDMQTGILK